MITNQELHTLQMPQIIIEDEKYNCYSFNSEENNKATIESMYRVQESIYSLFGKCDIREIESNTINPGQQNIFLPLKSWRVNLGGCFAKVSIHQRVWSGCYSEMEII